MFQNFYNFLITQNFQIYLFGIPCELAQCLARTIMMIMTSDSSLIIIIDNFFIRYRNLILNLLCHLYLLIDFLNPLKMTYTIFNLINSISFCARTRNINQIVTTAMTWSPSSKRIIISTRALLKFYVACVIFLSLNVKIFLIKLVSFNRNFYIHRNLYLF